MKTLLVTYSRTGNTQRIGNEIAKRLEADIEEIMDIRSHKGLLGFIRSGFEALRDKPAKIRQTSMDPKDYDLVIVGTPIWAGRMSSPARAYLQQVSGSLRKAAFFCTCSSAGYEPVMQEMAKIAKTEPVVTLELTKAQRVSQDLPGLLDEYVEKIRSLSY